MPILLTTAWLAFDGGRGVCRRLRTGASLPASTLAASIVWRALGGIRPTHETANREDDYEASPDTGTRAGGRPVVVAASAERSAADKLRVGKAVPFAWTFTPIDVGIEVGIFAKHGLELEVRGFGGDARMQQGLVSDSIDIGLGSGPGMGFLAKGVPAKAVAAMAGAPMNMSIVVPYNSPIKTLDDIKGKKIGITTVGSLTDWLLKRVVADKKWAPTDVTAVTVGGMDSTKAALKTGQIDGVVIALELGYALEEAKEWRVLAPLAPFAPDFHTHVIFARDELIAKKPRAGRALPARLVRDHRLHARQQGPHRRDHRQGAQSRQGA